MENVLVLCEKQNIWLFMDETTVLTMTYGKYAMKKLSVFEWHEWLKEG
jgi:hypothetical protein